MTELVARARIINPTTGHFTICAVHELSFSVVLRESMGVRMGPLGAEIASVVIQADSDQNDKKHEKAQEARNKAALAHQSPKAAAAAAKQTADEKKQKKAKKKAEEAKKDAKKPPGTKKGGDTRGRGPPPTDSESKAEVLDEATTGEDETDDADAGEAETPFVPARGRGINPLLELFTREFISKALSGLGKRCGRHLCHDGCSLSGDKTGARSNVTCFNDHVPDPLTAAEVAALPVETRVWCIVYGGFRGTTKVPYQMRTGAITKALADLSTTSGRGCGLSMQLPARFYEQYREVTPGDSDLQTPLASLVDRSVYNVFDQTPAPPAYHEPSECVESDVTARQERFRSSLVKSGTLRALSQEQQPHRLFTTWLANWVSEQVDESVDPAKDVCRLTWLRHSFLLTDVLSSPLIRDAALRIQHELGDGSQRGRGANCVVTGLPHLIVHDSVEIAGELAQACVVVMGIKFVAHEVGDEVSVGTLSLPSRSDNQYGGQCVIKTDAISDLAASRQIITNKVLAARSTQYLESLFEEALLAIEHLGPMPSSMTLGEAEVREHISDRKYFTEADVHYTTVLGGAHQVRDVLRFDPCYRRKVVVSARQAGATVRILVVDGPMFGHGDASESWVSYQLLYDHHCRPLVPCDEAFGGLDGAARFLGLEHDLGIEIVRRTDIDWRGDVRPDNTALPITAFHHAHGDRLRVRRPDSGTSGGREPDANWRGGRAQLLPLFTEVPPKLTEWLHKFALGPPEGDDDETTVLSLRSDHSRHSTTAPTVFTGASVLVVTRSGAILGQSRSSRLWEDFGGAREGSETSLETALRELGQETGLSAEDVDLGSRAPIVVSHKGHVHVVYVASTPARSPAFEVSADGIVFSTAETDGELSSFACFRGFDDFFAAELGDHNLLHRRIKDRRVMALAESVWRGLQIELRGAGDVGDVGDVDAGDVGVPPARPGNGGGQIPRDALEERISRGNQTRSAAGKRWEDHTLTKLLAIRGGPEVRAELEELSRLADTSFSTKAVRQGKDKQEHFYSTMRQVVQLMHTITIHYGDYRAAFAAFQSLIFNKRGTLASPDRQESMRGRVDAVLLNYIQRTTEHFVHTRLDGDAPSTLEETPPFASATAASLDILQYFCSGRILLWECYGC